MAGPMDRIRNKMTNYFTWLSAGDTESFRSLFRDLPAVDTPADGRITGNADFERFVGDQQAWLRNHGAAASLLAVTAGDERVALEFVLVLRQEGGTIDLPVAVVADRAGDGVSAIRVYHSTWPLTGAHRVRAPLLPPAGSLEEPPVIRQYMAGIGTPDVEAVLALFEPDGIVREPGGAAFRHEGPGGLRAFYATALAEGGVRLRHCTATFDGMRCAVEYICDGWGRVRFAPQAGIAVYELGSTGRIRAVRIYDDLAPPAEGA
jgi:hypothetical protein